MNKKKTESHQLSEKGFVFFLSFFFWTLIKAENGGVFSFVCCSFCPVIHSSWKTKPLHDPPWSRTPPESGGGHAKNWKLFFLFFFFRFLLILRDILDGFHRLSDPISLAALQGKSGGWRDAFWLFTWDLRRPFARWCRTDTVTSAWSNLPVSYPLTALTFFQCYLWGVFSTAEKKKKKRTQRKKNHKKMKKYNTKTTLSRSTHCIQNKHTYSVNTHTH